jgi:hypothetical protein
LINARSGRIRVRQVGLESAVQVAARYYRAAEVLARLSPPARTPDVDLCRGCAFVEECRPHLLARHGPAPHPRHRRSCAAGGR